MNPGDMFRFHGEGEICLVLSTSTSVYQIDEVEEEVRYLHGNGIVYDLAYVVFSGREYVGMREIEWVKSSPVT